MSQNSVSWCVEMKHLLVCIAVLLTCLTFAQAPAPLFQNFSNAALFNINDASCINMTGEWTGEEMEYYTAGGTLKGTYSVKFVLEQQGNKVSGYSHISFDNGRSFGKMKIRGLVSGNTFYFEEYEVAEQGFTQPGVLWCLRTGELTLKTESGKQVLEGANYKGYANYYYFACGGSVAMHLSKPANTNQSEPETDKSNSHAQNELKLHPNPAMHEVNVSFSVGDACTVQIDVFSLSGELIGNITSGFRKAGVYTVPYNLSELAAGVYLVRMLAGKQLTAQYLVISR